MVSVSLQPMLRLDSEEDPVDPQIIQETLFHERPTVGMLIAALMVFPFTLPVLVNGEGWLYAIESIDPTGAEPFQAIVYEPHVVIG